MDGPWLPDSIARWYDAFAPYYKDEAVQRWRATPNHERVRDQMEKLRDTPNDGAREIDDWISKAPEGESAERTYRALQAASRAVTNAGMLAPLDSRGSRGRQWREIRMQWHRTGNLLRNAAGILLPKRQLSYEWYSGHDWKAYDRESHFEGFLRWVKGTESIDVRTAASADVLGPAEALAACIRIGVVPLVGSVDDFDWQPVDTITESLFRVSLKNPKALEPMVDHAIRRSAEEGCAVTVFPELCLTPELQQSIRVAVRKYAAAYGFPLLVVAGTAHTNVEEKPDRAHNRAVVFDSTGNEIFQYNKLHPYKMGPGEEKRYSLAKAFGEVSRTEDIWTLPEIFSIADTPIGRIGVLICEDLTNERRYLPLVQNLEVDWLLVPVLDGVQAADRWTARNAQLYVGSGITVVVATSLSLVRAHLSTIQEEQPFLPEGVGLIVRSRGETHVLEGKRLHAEPVIHEIRTR